MQGRKEEIFPSGQPFPCPSSLYVKHICTDMSFFSEKKVNKCIFANFKQFKKFFLNVDILQHMLGLFLYVSA